MRANRDRAAGDGQWKYCGNTESAGTSLMQAVALAERLRDSDLPALDLLSQGQRLIQPPKIAGIVYYAVVLTCQNIFELQRARMLAWRFELSQLY
jgi:hypothetical protein